MIIQFQLFLSLVALDPSLEPARKKRSLESHCGWLCNQLYELNNPYSIDLNFSFLDGIFELFMPILVVEFMQWSNLKHSIGLLLLSC